MTPPTKVLTVTTSAFFPEGVTHLDEERIEEAVRTFQSKFLPQVSGFEINRKDAVGLGARLFADGRYRACTQFKEMVLPDVVQLPVLGGLDASLQEGARVCADLTTEGGILHWPDLISMEGFSILGIRPDRAILNDQGRLEVETGCCISKDVTDPILESPIGPLFPEGKITDIPLDRFTLFEFPPPPKAVGSGRFSKVMEALQLIGFWGEICTDALCAGPTAGIALYVDSPIFRETLKAGRIQSFDFTGIHQDSFIDWPQFPLSLLPLPPGIQIPEGSMDVSARYDPATLVTTIDLKNLDAKILIPDLFATEPILLSGGISIQLKAGGDIQIQLNGLRIELPSLPAQEFDPLTFSSLLTGNVSLHWDHQAGRLQVREAHLNLEGIEIKTEPGHAIALGKGGAALGLSLQGTIGLDYLPAVPSRTLAARVDLKGSALMASGKGAYDLRDVRLEGKLGWQMRKGRLLPNLDELGLALSTDLFQTEGGVESLVAKRLGFNLVGKGTSVNNGVTTREASFTAGAESFHLGELSFVPTLKMELVSQEEGEEIRMDGKGLWAVTGSGSTPISLGSSLNLHTTDFKNFDLSAIFSDDQVIGSLHAKGGMKVQGKLEFYGEGSILESFKIKTTQSYVLTSGGKRIGKGVKLNGKGSQGDSLITLRAPNLANRGSVAIDIYDFPWRDRLLGKYRIGGRPFNLNGDAALKDISIRGNFWTPAYSEFFSKKKIHLKGSANASLEGGTSGPLAADYHAVLRLLPEKSAVSLTFSSDKPSSLTLGPIKIQKDNTLIEGDAKLQGTLIAKFGGGGVNIGGDDLGIHDGKVFVGLKGPIPVDEQGKKIPAVYDLSFVADRLNKIRKGIAYCGGKRCRLEGVVDLVALKVAFDRDRSKLPVFKAPHRLQLSPGAWWAAFKAYVLGRE